MGKRGDQLVRAFEEPVDLVVIQHCNQIANTVVRQEEAMAFDPRQPLRYCIIDGADTVRILKTHRKLGFAFFNAQWSTPRLRLCARAVGVQFSKLAYVARYGAYSTSIL